MHGIQESPSSSSSSRYYSTRKCARAVIKDDILIVLKLVASPGRYRTRIRPERLNCFLFFFIAIIYSLAYSSGTGCQGLTWNILNFPRSERTRTRFTRLGMPKTRLHISFSRCRKRCGDAKIKVFFIVTRRKIRSTNYVYVRNNREFRIDFFSGCGIDDESSGKFTSPCVSRTSSSRTKFRWKIGGVGVC